MQGIFLSSLIFLISHAAHSTDFMQLVESLDKHKLIQASSDSSQAMKAKAAREGSFGDPVLSVSAMNFPRESLSMDESMMTGVQFGLSQKISLSGTYGKLKESGLAAANSQALRSQQLKREYIKELWLYAIRKELVASELEVLAQNLDWIQNNLKVTNRLYSTGKVSQEALLEVQMRRSELISLLEKKDFQLKSIAFQLSELLGKSAPTDLNLKSVPWKILEKWKLASQDQDYRLKSLEEEMKSQELKLSASRRSFVPDITFGINYTKRNDLDGVGDFVGAHIAIPLPSSDVKYSAKKEAAFEQMRARRTFRHYSLAKSASLKTMELDIEQTLAEQERLKSEGIKFAQSSRDISAKSYARGEADYAQLLRAQLQYQNQLLKKLNLAARLKELKINYLFVKGADLTYGAGL